MKEKFPKEKFTKKCTDICEDDIILAELKKNLTKYQLRFKVGVLTLVLWIFVYKKTTVCGRVIKVNCLIFTQTNTKNRNHMERLIHNIQLLLKSYGVKTQLYSQVKSTC